MRKKNEMENMKTKFLLIFVFAYILNFVWEYLHYPLYASQTLGMHNLFFITITSKLGLILYAIFVDAFWIFAVYLLIAIIDKKIEWEINWTNGILFSILLFVIAMTIERLGLARGLWTYASSMPIILGVGLSPLLQLAVTGMISLLLSRIKIGNRKR